MILIAMDRAQTGRRYDEDGHLHVRSKISKANICPYYGREIPGWQALGLDGDTTYRLLRHPDELAAAVATFNNKPILSRHVPVTADEYPSHLVVGTTGTSASFDGTYLDNDTAFWSGMAIDGIEANRQRELSSAYRYDPDMTPGNYDGLPYDGIMRNLRCNHVALVIEGRAGPDVIVGDENMLKSRAALMVSGAVAGLVMPLLAKDAKVDLSTAFEGVDAATLADPKLGMDRQIADKVVALVTPHLAADQALTADTVAATVKFVPVIAQDDAIADAPAPKAEATGGAELAGPLKIDVVRVGMDEAAVTARIAQVRSDVMAEQSAIRTAEREVAPFVGEIVAMDSAADVYKMALDAAKVDLTGVDPSAYRAMVKMLPDPNAAQPTPRVAMDQSGEAKFREFFPDAAPVYRS